MIALISADIRQAENLQEDLAQHGYGCVIIAGLAAGNDALLTACRVVVVDERSVPSFLDHQARTGAAASDVLVLVAVSDQDHVSALTARVIGYIAGIVAVVEQRSLSRALRAVLDGLTSSSHIRADAITAATQPVSP